MFEFQLDACRVDLARLLTSVVLFAVLLFLLARAMRKIGGMAGALQSVAREGNGASSNRGFVAVFLLFVVLFLAMDSWYSTWDLLNCLEDGPLAESLRPATLVFPVVFGLVLWAAWPSPVAARKEETDDD